jgi:hypothetical protein
MVKHINAKKQNKTKNFLQDTKSLLVGTGIGLAVAATPALAQDLEITSSVRARDNTEITHNLNVGNLSVNTYSDSEGLTTSNARFSIPLTDNAKTSVLGRQTTTKNQCALDLSIGDQYFQPVWLVWDRENNEFQGAELMAAGKIPLGSINADFATYWVLRNGENPARASYLTINNENIGIGFGEGYKNNKRADIGASNEDVGALCGVDFPAEGGWSGTLMVSQNPGGLLSANGPKLNNKVFTIGELPEFKTYLSGIANKGSEGVSFKIDAENLNGISTGAIETGYNFGNGLAISLGEGFSETESPSMYGKASVNKGNGFIEARYSEEGLETYLKYVASNF